MKLIVSDIEDDDDNYSVQIMNGSKIIYECKVQSFELSPEVLSDLIVFYNSDMIQ
jgi:hypothetical protein